MNPPSARQASTIGPYGPLQLTPLVVLIGSAIHQKFPSDAADETTAGLLRHGMTYIVNYASSLARDVEQIGSDGGFRVRHTYSFWETGERKGRAYICVCARGLGGLPKLLLACGKGALTRTATRRRCGAPWDGKKGQHTCPQA